MVSLDGLSPAEKMKKISGEGVPFLTLLWSKGHIALYLGDYTGRPMIFHNFWGIRTRDDWGREGARWLAMPPSPACIPARSCAGSILCTVICSAASKR